jgi:hypothetical protein
LSEVLDDGVNKSRLSREEADLILEHITEAQSPKRLRLSTVRARGHDLIRAGDFLHKAGKRYDQCTTAQVLKAVSGIRGGGYLYKTGSGRTIEGKYKLNLNG